MDPIKRKIDAQDSLINRFKEFNELYAPELLDKIFEYLDKFRRSKGLLILEKESGFLLAEFAKKLVDDFKNSSYVSNLGSLLGDFGELEKSTINLLATLNDNFDFDALDFSKEKKLIINELTENLLRPESFRVNIANDVRKIISRNLLTGAPITSLKNELKQAVSISKSSGGILGRYTTQITTDAVLQYGGVINDKVAKLGNFNAIGYTGSLIETSRVQCIRWINEKKGILLLNEKITGYGYLPDEVKWAKVNGTGYGKKGSTSFIELTVNNFAQFRGGYNCRHEALPFTFNDKYRERFEKMRDTFEKSKQEIIKNQKP